MRALVLLALAIAALAAAPSGASAEPDNLGGYKLGQKLKKKPKPKPLTIYGCQGEVVPTVGKGVVTEVVFTQEMETHCGDAEDEESEAQVLAAAIGQDLGGPPVEGAFGMRLWEGAHASILVGHADFGPGGPMPITITLGPRRDGGKTTCFPDDGFAAWFAGLKVALEGDAKPADLAAYFAFPFPDAVGELGSYKTAKTFVARAGKRLLAADTRAQIAAEEAPYCNFELGTYDLLIANGILYAARSGDTWKLAGVRERIMY